MRAVLGLVLWGFWAGGENVVVGRPGGGGRRVSEGHLVVKLVAVGRQVVAMVAAVRLVHGGAIEVLHLEVNVYIRQEFRHFIRDFNRFSKLAQVGKNFCLPVCKSGT